MKERVRQIITMLVLLSGVGQLALSQIHISASTKLFATESGFYLFLFVIFGLTTGLNAYLLKNMRGIVVLVGCGVLAVWSGITYMRLVQADVADQAALMMSDVQTSMTLLLASVVIYAVGIVVIPILSWGMADESAVA